MSLRIGSLFTGTGALDLAVMDVYDAEVVWHSQYEPPDKNGKEDLNQYAAKILARHWPNVPNLGDITKVDWQAVLDEYGPIDILTGGFPCQDVSSAGRRAGLTADSRSGLWAHMAHAIHELNPRLVIIENVEGLLSAPAASDMEPCAYCVGDGHSGPLLRACGAVLGDLATLGLDAEWGRYGADEVGAPHRRRRIIIRAWPAVQNAHLESWDQRRVAAPGQAESRWARSDAGRRGGASAADAGRLGLEVGGVEPDRHELPAVERGRREPSADTDGVESERRGVAGVLGSQATTQLGEGDQRERAGHAARDSREAPADADGFGRREDVLQLRPGQSDLDWGDYGPAVRRWERILGRRAPWPTDLLGRLSPVFTEWLMGLPDGWVTCTPGPESMSDGALRNAMLRALGNGVVRHQAAYALRDLHARAGQSAEGEVAA